MANNRATPWRHNSLWQALVPGRFCNSRKCLSLIEHRLQHDFGAQGLWTQEETVLYINVLELKGALFALKTFAQDLRKVHVHMKMDNRTAIGYIQKMGGTRSAPMLPVIQKIWKFALDRGIVLSAEYLPGSLNTETDWKFPGQQRMTIEEVCISTAEQSMGSFKLDLFASRLNTQLEHNVSWYPDPYAQALNAFQQRALSVSSLCMIPRCLMKVRQDKTSMVMIARP